MPPTSDIAPIEPPSSPRAPLFGSAMVSSKKMFILGLVIVLFTSLLGGIVYTLFFIFNKETRNQALIILAWAILWALITAFLQHSPILHAPSY